MLAAVEDVQYLNLIGTNPVNENIIGVNDELPCSSDPTRPSYKRVFAKALRTGLDPFIQRLGGLQIAI